MSVTLSLIQSVLFVCLETHREIQFLILCKVARIYLQPYVSINIICDAITETDRQIREPLRLIGLPAM